MNWVGRDWGPRAAVEAAAKAGPFLLREKAVVYRCPFCRRSWRSQGKRSAERHLAHCFARPDRVPYLGEIYDGKYSSHADAREQWQPAIGTIWDGKAWRDVPGCRYSNFGSEEDGCWSYVEEWPKWGGQELPLITPWACRLRIFKDFDRALARLSGAPDEGPYRIDDERLFRLVHGSGS